VYEVRRSLPGHFVQHDDSRPKPDRGDEAEQQACQNRDRDREYQHYQIDADLVDSW
jgi:hypothetical protein